MASTTGSRTDQRSVELVSFDVSRALPFGRETNLIVASVHQPAGPSRAILVCWPGGSYSRSYWEFSACPGYSFAAHMVEQGFTVVAADPLGVGESSRPADVDAVTLEVIAKATADFTRQLRQHLDPPSDVPLVGVGHSLGGCIVVMAQALDGCYDRVINVGYTQGAKDAVTADAGTEVDERDAAVAQARAFFSDWDAGYAISPRQPNHSWLYTSSTPAEIIAADDKTVTAWPRQSYVEALIPGYAARFAPLLTCPLLLGFGDHDIPPRPHDDVSFYTGSTDVSLVVLEDAAHSHNFASTRTSLWDRMGAWATGPTISPRRDNHD